MYLRAACFAQKQRFLFVFLAALFILLLSGTPPLVSARNKNQRKFVLIFNDQEARKAGRESLNAELSSASSASDDAGQDDSEQQDDFNDPDDFSLEDLDPGSWLIIAENFEPKEEKVKETEGDASMNAAGMSYMSGVSKLLDAASLGDPNTLAESVDQFLQAAQVGHPDAHSTLAFLYRNGIGVEHNDAKAFLYHSFAADAGNFQSKLALAYNYFRQQINEEAVRVYAELAGRAVASFSSALDSPLVEHVPLNDGLEENKEALKRYRGEEDDDFQILEYQARKGNAGAMFKVGLFYYSGLRGIQRDDAKALYWFLKGIEKGDTTAMEFVGEIYARGHGVERNFTKALEWFKAALRNKRFSAYNGIGYLYVKGLGVDKRNYTVVCLPSLV